MSNRFSLQTLALIGIIAVSGLPALAGEMTPATPAPGAAVQSDTKAGVSGAGNAASTGINAKVDSKVLPTDSKDGKVLPKDAKDSKPTAKDVQAAKDKTKQEQTAKLPAATAPAPSVPAPTPTVSGSTGTSVQH